MRPERSRLRLPCFKPTFNPHFANNQECCRLLILGLFVEVLARRSIA